MERAKPACTPADMTTLKDRMQKLDMLIFVHEREPIQNGNFTNLQI